MSKKMNRYGYLAKTVIPFLVMCLFVSLFPFTTNAAVVRDEVSQNSMVTMSGDEAPVALIDYLADVGILLEQEDSVSLVNSYTSLAAPAAFGVQQEEPVLALQVVQQRESELIVSVVTCLDISESEGGEGAGFVDVPFVASADAQNSAEYKPSGTNVKLIGSATYDIVHFDLFQVMWVRPQNAYISYWWDGGHGAVDWIAVGYVSDGSLCDNNKNVLQSSYGFQITRKITAPMLQQTYGCPNQSMASNRCIWLNTNTIGGAMQLGLEAKIDGREYGRGFQIP